VWKASGNFKGSFRIGVSFPVVDFGIVRLDRTAQKRNAKIHYRVFLFIKYIGDIDKLLKKGIV